MLKRIIIRFAAFSAFIGLVYWIYAWHRPLAPIIPFPPEHFSETAIRRGAVIAASGYCAECHTRHDGFLGAQFAGDYKMNTPFGAIYSSNITPDVKTGIGAWSGEAFRKAMREGISRDGHHLYPAFPFDHFTKMTDQDLNDLYAYLMTRPATLQRPRKNDLIFPFNLRFLQAGWKFLFLHSGSYVPDQQHDPLFNRGAYLAEGAGHCAACHSPRNIMGAEKKGAEAYNGAEIDGWRAPPLNGHNPSPVSWNEEELYAYLRTGSAPLHGVTAGVMAEIIHTYLSQFPDADIHALAHYFASKMTHKDDEQKDEKALAWAMSSSQQDLSRALNSEEDARLYQVTCAQCHSNFGHKLLHTRPELALNSALWLDEPTNLFQVMLGGVKVHEGQEGLVMPSFATALSDHDMARIAAYLRRTRTTLPPWKDLEKKAAQIRAKMKAQSQ